MLQRQRNDRARPATFAEHAFNLLHADMVRAKLRPGEKLREEATQSLWRRRNTAARGSIKAEFA
jgi:DNA-binding GntR family transcriptional regulator